MRKCAYLRVNEDKTIFLEDFYMSEKELTGYPSIDKPWLKYYSDEAINISIPQRTVYESIYDNNIEHLWLPQ